LEIKQRHELKGTMDSSIKFLRSMTQLVWRGNAIEMKPRLITSHIKIKNMPV